MAVSQFPCTFCFGVCILLPRLPLRKEDFLSLFKDRAPQSQCPAGRWSGWGQDLPWKASYVSFTRSFLWSWSVLPEMKSATHLLLLLGTVLAANIPRPQRGEEAGSLIAQSRSFLYTCVGFGASWAHFSKSRFLDTFCLLLFLFRYSHSRGLLLRNCGTVIPYGFRNG